MQIRLHRSMGKMMGTPKPLARSSAISDTESKENDEAMEVYTKWMQDAKKGKWREEREGSGSRESSMAGSKHRSTSNKSGSEGDAKEDSINTICLGLGL